MSAEERARGHFDSGYNCAQSVLLAVSQQLGVKTDLAESPIPKMATGFGGGIARNGDTCGALSGAIMSISLALGCNGPNESRDSCYKATDLFYNEFLQKFGTCNCRKLTGADLKTEAGLEELHARIRYEVCDKIVGWSGRRACQIIQALSGQR